MDAKAKSHGVSLNDLLLKGPDFIPSLSSQYGNMAEIGFIADIAEMFHQVMIRQEDHCSQRLLGRGTKRGWYPDVIEMIAMTFGAVFLHPRHKLVKNYNANELESTYPGVTRAITLQHYVDGCYSRYRRWRHKTQKWWIQTHKNSCLICIRVHSRRRSGDFK